MQRTRKKKTLRLAPQGHRPLGRLCVLQRPRSLPRSCRDTRLSLLAGCAGAETRSEASKQKHKEERGKKHREQTTIEDEKRRRKSFLYLGKLQRLDVLVAGGALAQGDPVDKGGRRGGLGRRAEGQGGHGHQGEKRRAAAHD